MAGANEHAALARDEWEDVPRRDDVLMRLVRIDGRGDGERAVVGRDARRNAFLGLDGYGEGRAVAGTVVARHQLEAELMGALLGHREADEPAAMLGHEVDLVGRRHLRRDDEVALVLAVLGIDENDHAAVAQVIEDVRNGRDEALPLGIGDARKVGEVVVGAVRHRRISRSRAT